MTKSSGDWPKMCLFHSQAPHAYTHTLRHTCRLLQSRFKRSKMRSSALVKRRRLLFRNSPGEAHKHTPTKGGLFGSRALPTSPGRSSSLLAGLQELTFLLVVFVAAAAYPGLFRIASSGFEMVNHAFFAALVRLEHDCLWGKRWGGSPQRRS